MFKAIKDFINYWYFRYLLVTELYMVEKWERAMFHTVLFLVLSILYIFNTTVILGLVRTITGMLFQKDIVKLDQNINTEPVANM